MPAGWPRRGFRWPRWATGSAAFPTPVRTTGPPWPPASGRRPPGGTGGLSTSIPPGGRKPPPTSTPSGGRYEGFRREAAALALETVLVTESGYCDAVCALLRGEGPRTAVLLPSDYQALQLLLALGERGIAVPEQAGVCGFDNIATLRYIRPRPATVGYSIEAIGAGAVDRVLGGGTAGPVPFAILPGDTL